MKTSDPPDGGDNLVDGLIVLEFEPAAPEANGAATGPTARLKKTVERRHAVEGPPDSTALLDDVRATLHVEVDQFVDDATKYWADPENLLPPARLLGAGTGSGKSRQLRHGAMRAAHNPGLNGSIVIAVPRHRLGDEQIDLLRRENPSSDLEFAVWRGRKAPDPETPGRQMCWRADEVAELTKLSIRPDRLCRHTFDNRIDARRIRSAWPIFRRLVPPAIPRTISPPGTKLRPIGPCGWRLDLVPGGLP